MEELSRVDILATKIHKHSKEYYEGESSISDEEFDSLVEELRSIEPTHYLLTQHGWGMKTNGTAKHRKPIYKILTKIKDKKVATDKLIGMLVKCHDNVVIQPKYDGASVTLYYKDGKLEQAITRGDGEYGYDIKNNINLDGYENLITDGSVRCEVAMSWKNWSQHYDMEVNPSPRNLITGIIGKKDPTDIEKSIVDVIVLDVELEVGATHTPNEKIKYAEVLEAIEERLPVTEYPTDGYVIKSYNSPGEIDEVWAYKPMSAYAETTVKDISWQKGNTGRYTPVLHIEPVKLSGATIGKVTANSMRFLEEKGAGVGARLKVFRSGEVIPCILDTVERSEDYRVPPSTHRYGAHVYANNNVVNMYGNFMGMMTHTKDLGWSIVNSFLGAYNDGNMPKDFQELAKLLERIDSSELDELTDYQARMIKQGMNNIRYYTRRQLLLGMNIPDVGPSAIDKYLKGENLPSHSEASMKMYAETCENIIAGLYRQHLIEVPAEEEEKPTIGFVAITGKHEMKRSDMESRLRSMGFVVQGGVNKDTNYLIIADVNSTSSKAKSARNLGVKLVSSIDELVGAMNGN